jgi:hypothetical protein
MTIPLRPPVQSPWVRAVGPGSVKAGRKATAVGGAQRRVPAHEHQHAMRARRNSPHPPRTQAQPTRRTELRERDSDPRRARTADHQQRPQFVAVSGSRQTSRQLRWMICKGPETISGGALYLPRRNYPQLVIRPTAHRSNSRKCPDAVIRRNPFAAGAPRLGFAQGVEARTYSGERRSE